MKDSLYLAGCGVLAALLLTVAFLGESLHGRWPSEVSPLRLEGSDMQLIAGRGKLERGRWMVHPAKRGPAVLALPLGRYDGGRYPFLSLAIEPWPLEGQAILAWRGEDGKVHRKAMPLVEGRSVVDMGNVPGWKGTVQEMALALDGDPRQSFGVEAISLEPASPGAALLALFTAWRAFEGWSGRSINYVVGGSKDAQITPVAAAAAWAFTATLLALLLRRRAGWRAALAFLVLAWLLLHARWQWDLWRQARLTVATYGGKSWEEKHLAAEDGRLFAFIQEIKAHLPQEPQRILLLTPGPHNEYVRIRAIYHLLPHNVGPYALTRRAIHAADYILVLGRVPDMAIRRGILRKGGVSVSVRPVLVTPVGQLFEIL